MKVLMVGVDESTKGGMWTVAENYLNAPAFVSMCHLSYVPTSIVGNPVQKVCFTIKGFLKIFRVFRMEKVDITHVHMSERGSVYRKGLVMRYARKHGSRILLHMHGAEFEDWYRGLNAKRQQQVRSIVDSADEIIILGEYWQNFISGLVRDPHKIRVVPNAVSIPKERLYSPDSRRLLFLGAVSMRKGIYDLLDAMQQISPELSPEWKLDIYGPNVMGNVEDEIEKRDLSSRVFYRGWLPPGDRAEVLSHTAVNILPSYHEGLPMTIMEAMAAGIPSIATNVAAIPEAVNDDNGILLQPGDTRALGQSILTLCNHHEMRLQKSENSYRTAVEKFSLEKHLCRIANIYRELLDL